LKKRVVNCIVAKHPGSASKTGEMRSLLLSECHCVDFASNHSASTILL